ncbi:MAG: hypothetical protein ACI8W8_003312 [Rhodothermales bacterium]|jgi:hypothetical protein
MLSPLMLLGLLGLSLPIAIHLIQKQRLKPQPLATLRFLDKEDVANAFAPVPRDMLQLILRLLLLAILVLLLARITLPSDERGPRTMVLVLDQSMSMQQQHSETQTLYAVMKSQIVELLESMQAGDRISLQLVGDRVQSTDFIEDKDELLQLLADTDVHDTGALALMPTIRQSVNLLRSRHEVNPSVIVFSDHQASNYATYQQEQEIAESADFRAHLADSRVKLIFIDPESTISENIGIEQAAFSTSESYLGASAAVTVTARNYGSEAKTVNLMFHEGQTDAATRELTLQPGETAQMDLIHGFENPVDAACRVTIDEDALSGDNSFHLPMRMRARTLILLVAPAADAEDTIYRGQDLLTYAFNPGEALGRGSGTFINIKKQTPNMMDKEALPIYSMIVLYGVADLSAQSQKDLRDYVNNGGGLLLIPRSDLSPGSIRQGLGNFLGGITVGQIKEGDTVQGLNRNKTLLDSPLLYPLIHGDWGDVDGITVSRYFALENTDAATVLLRAKAGDPLIVSVPMGKGQVILQAFDCELGSSSLPRTAAFVSLCQELSAQLTGNGPDRQVETMRAGDVLRVHTPEFRNSSGDVHIDGPDHFEVPIAAGDDSIRVDNAVRAGAYALSHPLKKTGRKHWVTVNPVLGESDTTALGREVLSELFGPGMTFTAYAKVDSHFQNRREIIPIMVLLVFVAFVVEALFAAWQSRSKAEVAA